MISLSDQNAELKELAPNSTIDEVIHHEIKEIGTHMYDQKKYSRKNKLLL